MPSIWLSFLAWGIGNEDRFEEDEHKAVGVKAREAISWSDQFKDSEIWHHIEGQSALTQAGGNDFFQRDCCGRGLERGMAGEANSQQSPTDQQDST